MEENQPLSHFRRPSPGPEKQPVPLVDYVLNTMKFVDAILSNNSTRPLQGVCLTERPRAAHGHSRPAQPAHQLPSPASLPSERLRCHWERMFFLKSVTYWPTRKFRGAPV